VTVTDKPTLHSLLSMRDVARRALALVLTVATASCTTTTTYYAAVARTAASPQAAPTDDARVTDPAVQSQLGPGVTLALYPPDSCTTTAAAPPGSAGGQGFVQMQCGVLMSGLEKAAAGEGYNVVSWQLLKGDPLGRARELHVDFLLEVDELSIQSYAADVSAVTDISFFEVTADGREPLEVADAGATAARCKALLGADLAANAAQTATLSVKMTGVADGRAKWFYRHTTGQAASGGERVFYYGAQKPTATGGLVALGAGGALLLAGLVLEPPLASFLLLSGAGVGGVGAIVALAQALKSGPHPDELLCAGPGIGDPFAAPAPAAGRPETRSARGATYRFTDAAAGSHDEEAERRQRLVQQAVADFTAQLRALRAR
jgi:hypothetical protein